MSIKPGTYDGTAGAQYVKIRGTKGDTEELHCVANFNQIGQDVECTVTSRQIIGTYRCIVWRTTTTDGWGFNQVPKEFKISKKKRISRCSDQRTKKKNA